MSRLRIALCVLATFSGCMSVRLIDETSLESGALPVLASDQGILVVHVHTDVPIRKLQISQWTALSDLPKGEHLRLLALGVGGYRWSGVVIPAGEGDVSFRIPREEFFEFRVEPGRINYPGELTFRGKTQKKSVEVSPIVFRNRSALMLRMLRERFPVLLERYQPVYTGQKSDGYLEYFGKTFLATDNASGAGSQ